MDKQVDIDFSQIERWVTDVLKTWHAPESKVTDSWFDFLVVREVLENNVSNNDIAALKEAVKQTLLACMETLAQQEEQVAQVLQLRFVDKQKLWTVAYEMSISEQTVSRLQKKGVQQLTELIQQREVAKRQQFSERLLASLPPATYTKLFGVQPVCQQLLDLLIDADVPALVAVIGLGGIGKTALVDTAVRQIIRHFHFQRVVWLRIENQTLTGHGHNPERIFENLSLELAAKLWPNQVERLSPQQRLEKLRQELTRLPYLIVIDNLESPMDFSYILDHLHGWAQPTKFLLTSRSRLSERTSVYNLRLPELSMADAIALIRHHAQECGIAPVAEAADEDIANIYTLTGGNPLALKLVASLLDVLPLAEVLADLTHTHTRSIEGMYRYIYWQAWRTLTENGRILLQAMPLVSESGGTPDYLAQFSALSKENLWPALHELHQRSLIEARGDLHQKRYGIHRLTHSFLCTEIINMQE
jgi:hypothetical protein